MHHNQSASFGDHAEVTWQTKGLRNEEVGVEGYYHVECRDKDGNLKWEETIPNLVVAVGKQLMFDSFLSTSGTYSTVGPFIGLIDGSTTPTFSAADTMASHAGWTEFVNYTTGGNPVRGTASFAAATSTGVSPANVTSKTASAITYTITGIGGTVGGCFLVTGTGAVSTQNSTAGTLYSAGAFGAFKVTTAGDTVAVSYSTTAQS